MQLLILWLYLLYSKNIGHITKKLKIYNRQWYEFSDLYTISRLYWVYAGVLIMTAIFVMGSCFVGIFLFVTWGVYYTKSRNLLLAYLLSLYMNYHCFMIISIYTVKLSPWNSGNMPTLLLALRYQLANLHTQIFCVCKCARPCIISNAAQYRSGSLIPSHPLPHSFAITGIWLLLHTQIKQLHFYIVSRYGTFEFGSGRIR